MDVPETAFEFAKSLAEQLITLATGIITLTITFAKDITGQRAQDHVGWLKASWCIYLFSILGGIWTLMALTGTLMPVTGSPPENPTFGFNVRLPAGMQILLFLVGTVCILTYGFKTFKK